MGIGLQRRLYPHRHSRPRPQALGSDIEKGIYDTAQQELLASLPKINVFSQATQNDINSQLEAYKNKGMQTINDTYNPLLENLKTDIASRFGNLNNSVFFDNLNSIEKNRANAISDLAQDIEAQRSDLFNNELSKRYNYLNFMNDLQNQPQWLKNLQVCI